MIANLIPSDSSSEIQTDHAVVCAAPNPLKREESALFCTKTILLLVDDSAGCDKSLDDELPVCEAE